jgi:alpha,alpha-trehalose phosphorylase
VAWLHRKNEFTENKLLRLSKVKGSYCRLFCWYHRHHLLKLEAKFMIHRERVKYPQYIYPPDEWKMVEKRFYPKYLAQMESIFATSNGYLGMRGNFDEGEPAFQNAVVVNGFHETWPITYGEEAFGFAKQGQNVINVPDGKIIKLYVDDEPFYLPTADLLHFERVLDMKAGVLIRQVLWETPSKKRVRIESQRLVSFHHRHLAVISYKVTLENAAAPVVISSEIVTHRNKWAHPPDDPRRSKEFLESVLVTKVHWEKFYRLMLGQITKNSDMRIACGVDHVIETDCRHIEEASCDEESGKVVFSVSALPRRPIRIIKYLTYHTSRRAPMVELCERAERTLDRSKEEGFEAIFEDQKLYMNGFWQRSDIKIKKDPAIQQAIRFNLFHLFQAAGRAEGTGIPAKGLTGLGYGGHYFWDTEIYMLPFLIYTAPKIARNLLRFRHSMLGKARERASQVNQKGALFPWRTINGEEASANYGASTAQYHINADIMYAVRKYVEVTADKEFLNDQGAEMLVETARLWLDLGFYSKLKGGKFCINGVTGPDEYNTVVNNNLYTNLMARENLWFAAATIRKMRVEDPESFAALRHKTDLHAAEVNAWQHAADHMFLPVDEKTGIHLQDDGFWGKKPWDFENTPSEKYPLLLNYHPLVIYRHQVIKQADVVLAMFLLGNEFSIEEKKRNFDFYDKLTTGDSSLSVSIQSIIAFELGQLEKASEYALYSVLMDLADIAGNVKDGLHMASMGGTWMTMVYGFAGMRDYEGRISFRPRLPKRFIGGSFCLTIRGCLLEVEIDLEIARYTLKQGNALTIHHEEEGPPYKGITHGCETIGQIKCNIIIHSCHN